MKPVWRLPSTELSRSELDGRRIDTVLVEFDGPEIMAVWGPDSERRLAVACDEDAGFVRWLEAPLRPDQWLELNEGALSLREALMQDTVWVIDQARDGTPLRGWRISSSSLDDEVLPDVGALLPSETRRRFSVGPRVASAELRERDQEVPRGRTGMHRMVA